ncbi:hypothetical protein EUGRSUZ_E00952 [Eucalyptus grandis]|uniref:Uncharacterized protein n=2 Tax=Eucalyptus grandis TaxID=71139 RepID=A0ACC3KPD3_EUCGR|nr:hypothetical protein EUGRSUZ_E00952 [Eucalyptus grandis]
MAEAVVSSVGQTIGKLLVNEAKFLRGVEDKVEDLQRELRLIQCLLRDADARRKHNEAVGECVAQLRDLAYDAEDLIERYILRATLKEGQNTIKAYACFLAKCSCVQVHGVGTEIEGLKSRISNLRTSMPALGIQSVNEGERELARTLMPKRTYDHLKEDFVGREDSIAELVKELLTDGEMRRVIFIWGMGGLGKTSLARKVIAHDKVENTFNSIAWACVSQEYHPKNILVGILIKLIPDQRKKVMEMMDDELFKTLYEIQQEKRCIIVLDDIWTKEAWDSIRDAFPVNDSRSKLLITTRNKEVAKYIDPQGFFHELQCLSDQESWDLLMKRVFPKTKVITEDMKNLAYELLKKCAGLPLAIIVLGGLLAINEWKTIHEKINLHFSDKSDVSKLLALSYEDLPWHLKPCFLFLSNFPGDAEIPAMEVLYMWIAEGFVLLNAYDKEREISVEDVAEQYLTELVHRGMVQVRFNFSGKIKRCHLHDLMRDLCVSKALQESFLSILNIQQDNNTENCYASMAKKVESSCKTRRLSFNGNMIPSLNPIGRTLVHLRTLVFFGSFELNSKPFHPIFNHCKFLRVLKIEKLILGRNLPESLGDLVHLRLLSLKNSDFEGLPQSMGNLICMEFLDLLSSGYGVSVPNVLWKMRRLRYLRLPLEFAIKEKFHSGGKKLQLGALKNLRTLRNFDSKKCDVNDIGKFTDLQKLTIFDMYDPIEQEIFLQIAKFKLKHLRFSSFYLRKLRFLWTEEKLPEHKSLPEQLRKLVLLGSQLKEDPMPILEKLPHLVVLMLGYWAFKGKEMVCSAGGFPQLKHLIFAYLNDLEEWRAAEGAVPHLSRLGITGCPELRAVPSHVPTYDDVENEKLMNNCNA